jgi:hypothetical protein
VSSARQSCVNPLSLPSPPELIREQAGKDTGADEITVLDKEEGTIMRVVFGTSTSIAALGQQG